MNPKGNVKHGKRYTRLYNIWKGIKTRCNNPNHKSYKNYGARGIKICCEWNEFQSFYEWAISNGYKENLTIDRIDVNGNYEPSNCRWVTMTQQLNNTRVNRYITLCGETHTVAEWARKFGISYWLMRYRFSLGLSDEELFELCNQPLPPAYKEGGV